MIQQILVGFITIVIHVNTIFCNTTVIPPKFELNPCHNSTDCDSNAYCSHLHEHGGYNCTCNEGYLDMSPNGHKPGRACVKLINECASQMNNCSANAHCTDLDIGYNCTCMSGYLDKNEDGLYGRVCAYVHNPCSNVRLNECDPRANCTHLEGDKYKCECEPPYRDNSTKPDFPGRHCIYDGCGNSSLNNCGPNAECINGDNEIICKCKNGFVKEDGSGCVSKGSCGEKVCNDLLGLHCNNASSTCECNNGWMQKDENSTCTETVRIDMSLWIKKHDGKLIEYSPEMNDDKSTMKQKFVNSFLEGIDKTNKGLFLSNFYMKSDVREIVNPAKVNPNWNKGIWVEFTSVYEKRGAPNQYSAWRILTDTLKNSNYSMDGAKMSINEYQLPLPCYNNTCDVNAHCTELSPTTYTCVCSHEFFDNDTDNPGRSCIAVTTPLPATNTSKDTCGHDQECKNYVGETCVNNRCVCESGKARRDPNEACKEYDHVIDIPVIIVPKSFIKIENNSATKSLDIYHQYVSVYVRNIDKALKATDFYGSVVSENVTLVTNSSAVYPNQPNGILFSTEIAVAKETNDKELCQQLLQAIRENRNFIGDGPLKIVENFDFCNPDVLVTEPTTFGPTTVQPDSEAVVTDEIPVVNTTKGGTATPKLTHTKSLTTGKVPVTKKPTGNTTPVGHKPEKNSS